MKHALVNLSIFAALTVHVAANAAPPPVSVLDLSGELRLRSGDPGLGQLEIFDNAAVLTHAVAEDGSVGLSLQPVFAQAGTPDPNAQYGSLPAFGPVTLGTQREQGLGIQYVLNAGDRVHIRVGSTPIGFPIFNGIGELSWRITQGPVRNKLGLQRLAVQDSLLAYGGRTDPHTGQLWGGVLKTRLFLEGSQDFGGWGLYASGAHLQVSGRHVLDNTGWETSVGSYHALLGGPLALSLGTNLTAFGFEHNQSHFTLGHGGYYSPRRFLRMGVSATLDSYWSRWQAQLRADLGRQSATEDPAPFFPLDPALGNQEFGGSNSDDISINGHVRLKYAADTWELAVTATLNQVNTYTERILNLQLRLR